MKCTIIIDDTDNNITTQLLVEGNPEHAKTSKAFKEAQAIKSLLDNKEDLKKYLESTSEQHTSKIITPLFDYVSGGFDMKTGKISSVPRKKHASVDLCFEGNMLIPFARIKLHEKETYQDAIKVFPDAEALGREIELRWNTF